VIDMGVHDLDMVRWLTGQEITDLRGFASEVTWGEPLPGDPETVNLVIRLSGGASAVVSLARRHPPGDLCRLDVLGGDHAVALSYLQPATADAVMREALRAQAEGLAATIAGDRSVGATVADAAAALVAAERAGALLAPAAIEGATL
jgi:myo-inositol 2-dehydrogenase/D-chiro-inositol 1-dehydrogenase